jgi:uncharacterized protein (DUF2461 family)
MTRGSTPHHVRKEKILIIREENNLVSTTRSPYTGYVSTGVRVRVEIWCPKCCFKIQKQLDAALCILIWWADVYEMIVTDTLSSITL